MLDGKLPPSAQVSPPRDLGGGGCGGAIQPAPTQTMTAESPSPPDFDKPPAPGGVCHDYVGDRIGMPPPKNGIRRTEPEVTEFLSDPQNGYTKNVGPPPDKLPPGTVVQFGAAHVGIVGPDGRIHHYTQAAPKLGIEDAVHHSNSISDITDTTRTWIDPGTGKEMTNQPYINTPVQVWLPPAKSKP